MDAYLKLGEMYEESRGVWRDYVRAYIWFDLAAAANVELALLGRQSAAEHMTPAQIAKAQRLAGEWKPKKSSTAGD